MVTQAGMIDGAIIGGVVGAMMYPVFMLYAKRQQKQGKAMGKPSHGQVFWTGSYAEAFQRAINILLQHKAEIVSPDQEKAVILAGTGGNFRSTGSTIHVRFFTVQGGIQVNIEVAPSMSLYDSGFSRSFVKKFVDTWNSLPGPMPFVH
jgi:hypothetical protein